SAVPATWLSGRPILTSTWPSPRAFFLEKQRLPSRISPQYRAQMNLMSRLPLACLHQSSSPCVQVE
ncbi:mut-7, partial [Symbiodinium pilosum]